MTEYGYGTVATVGADGFNTVDYVAMNRGITPVFMKVPIHNERESEAQGRAVYTDTEVVHLHIAGDSYSVHSQPVDAYIKARFPEQYAHWKRTEEGRLITGTPLKLWPMASPSFIKEMEVINIFSVDDLANIADVHVTKIPDGRVWRERAQSWLNAAKDTAAQGKFAAENERLRDRIEALEKMVTAPEAPSVPAAKQLRSHSTAKSERMKLYWARRKAAKADTAA